jgi:hypothetical protein
MKNGALFSRRLESHHLCILRYDRDGNLSTSGRTDGSLMRCTEIDRPTRKFYAARG